MNKDAKIGVAKHQLETAIRLYFECDYVCALALAGAAEEILGKIVAERQEAWREPALEELVDVHVWIKDHCKTSLETIKSSEWKNRSENKSKRNAAADYLNRPRNAAKHPGVGDSLDLPCCETVWREKAGDMLGRALLNFQGATGAFLDTEESNRFHDEQIAEALQR